MVCTVNSFICDWGCTLPIKKLQEGVRCDSKIVDVKDDQYIFLFFCLLLPSNLATKQTAFLSRHEIYSSSWCMNHNNQCTNKDNTQLFVVLFQCHCSDSSTVTDEIRRAISESKSSGGRNRECFNQHNPRNIFLEISVRQAGHADEL